jgi:hypothetical protein
MVRCRALNGCTLNTAPRCFSKNFLPKEQVASSRLAGGLVCKTAGKRFIQRFLLFSAR